MVPLKSNRIALQSIDFRLKTWKKAVESGELGEDDISAISNDIMLLQGVRDELVTKLAAHRAHVLEQSLLSR